MLLRSLLKYIVREGTLELTDARGRTFRFGDGNAPRCGIKLLKKHLDYSLVLNPPLRLGEAYMAGDLELSSGDLEAFMLILSRNYAHLERHWLVRLCFLLGRQVRWLKQYNPVGRAQRNVAHHYDLSGHLYDLFLDQDRQYSCAYFDSPDDSLEQAQRNKKRHLAAKLLLDQPDLQVLDIGSGWGGLGLYLASVANCQVTGVTLSVEQHKVSQQRAQEADLAHRAQFELKDYRHLDRKFDRIVSVGMFEHVGKRNYDEFFAKVADLLDEDGVCVLHTIGRFNEPGPINPFIRKYIFPGADVPTLSEMTPVIERHGLLMTDIEILRLHYAETLRHWRQRFYANWSEVAKLYDERFCRMWDCYLTGCEMGFRHMGLTVFQVQMTKRQEALPLTRDYIYAWEHRAQAQQSEAAQ